MSNLKHRIYGVLRPNPSRFHLETWLRVAAATGSDSNFRVLDAGAGSGLYRHLFDGLHYESADFGLVDKDYREPLTYTCDLTDIPVDDEHYDLVVCTQVLEHVPEPIRVLTELRRVVKPGCAIYASAPLFYPEHETPYDFYRYTQYAWRFMAERAGLEVTELEWLEGYYGTLSFQLSNAARDLPIVWLPIKALFRAVAWILARADMRSRRTEFGQPKNYRVVLRRPV